MAISYTSNIYITSSRIADGYVEAWLHAETDTTATIYWKIGCRQKWAALYGQEAYGYVDGSYVGYTSGYLSSSADYFKEVCSTSGYATVNKSSSARNVPVTVSTRVTVIDGYGSVTTDYESATVYVSVPAITYYAPNAPTALNAFRESDSKNALSWTAPSTSTTKPVSAILIERQVDGGSWSQIASVSGTATSYADATTAADHYYRYRIRSKNTAGYSSYVTSGFTYNTPAAPTKVTASRLAETTVKLEVENASVVAQYLAVQRRAEGGEWATVSQVSGAPVTETTDEPGGGTFYYRARNGRDAADGGTLWSAWSAESNAVVTITPPAAPTLTSPASGAVVEKSRSSIDMTWLHNPIDGSAQTAAKLRYSLDKGATWVEVAIDGNAASYALENAFAVNSEVTWGVCTKGAHADYGPWSGNRTFNVYQSPTLAFSQPADGFTIENTPIAVQMQYSDPSGSLAALSLSVSDGDRIVYSRDMGTDAEASISSSEWVPADGVTYHLIATARSTSTLTATATRDVAVDFEPPMSAGASVSYDLADGSAKLSLFIEQDDELQPPVGVTVYREAGGVRTLLGEGLQAGAGIDDRYAPVNVDYRYVLVSVADSGAVSTTYVPARVSSRWFYFMWGTSVARACVSPSGTKKLSRPTKRRVWYAGRALPVSYDDPANLTDTRSLSFTLRTQDEADAFAALMADGGRCVYKSGDGEVIHADVDVTLKPAWRDLPYYGDASVTVSRIDGGEL